MVNQPYPYYCIIDFEATNKEDPNNPGHGYRDYPSEIIQFSVVLIDSTGKELGTFNRYVRPTRNPRLSRHILTLTGITQEQVDHADVFDIVFRDFENWLSEFSERPFNNVCFVSDGTFDFETFLSRQCNFSGIPFPNYVRSYLDIKTFFKNYYYTRYLNIRGMLNHIGMTFIGSNHNGLDDAINIARIVQHLMKRTRLDKNRRFY